MLTVQTAWHFDEEAGEEVAAITRVDVGDAFAAQLEHLTALSSRWHFQIRFALECRDRNFATERCNGEGNRHFAVEVVLFALKDRVLFYVDDNVKVTGWPAADSSLPIA